MIDPAVMRAMLEAGCTAEQIVAVAEAAAHAVDEKKAAKRANNAERQRRFRERNAMSRVTGVTNADDALQVSPKKETSPTPPKEKTTPSSSEARASSLNPRGELELVLDAERAKAVIDHRQRIGKPLTAYAAKQLAGKMAQCPDPNAAADEMIANGWQGFKPEWLESRSRQQGPPGNRKPNAVDAMHQIFQERGWTSEPEILRSDHSDDQRVPPERSGYSGAVVDLRSGAYRRV